MKDEFYRELRKKTNSEIYIKAADKIRCFNCLDIGKVWRDRGFGAFMDARGSYDFLNCSKCQGNGCWSQCSFENNTKFRGIRICKESFDLMNRLNGFLEKDFQPEIDELEKELDLEKERELNELKEKYENVRLENVKKEHVRIENVKKENIRLENIRLENAVPDNAVPDNAVPDNAVPDNAVPDNAVPENINNPEPEWNRLECSNINQSVTEKSVTIAVDKIVNVVGIIVNAYVGDIPTAVSQCKKFTVSLCTGGSKESKTENKIVKEKDNYGNNVYVFLTLTQSQTSDTVWYGIRTDHSINLNGDMYVMSPSNIAAENLCQELIREKASNLMNVISSINMFKKI